MSQNTFLEEMIKQEKGLIILSSDNMKHLKGFMFLLLDIYKHKYPNGVYSLEKEIDLKDDIIQLQVNEEAGFDYPAGVKQILRHAPNLVMIDEIRDVETAKIVNRAVKNNYFIISSVKPENAAKFIDELCDAETKEKISKYFLRFKSGKSFDELMVEYFENVYELLYEEDFKSYECSVKLFDLFINEQWFVDILKHFESARGDLVTSGRECASFVIMVEKLGLLNGGEWK